MFVADLPADQFFEEAIAPSISIGSALIHYEVDREHKRVTSSLLGVESSAVYRGAHGLCVHTARRYRERKPARRRRDRRGHGLGGVILRKTEWVLQTNCRKRSELSRTETLDSDIAALASSGESSQPVAA